MVPVLIHESTGVDRKGDVLVGGVPVARGKLRSGGAFELRAKGRAFAVDGAPAAWWPDGSVKWLHLCGAVDLPGGKTSRLRLVRCRGGSRGGLTASSEGGVVRIRGGRLDVDVKADPLAAVAARMDGRDVLIGPGISAAMTFVDPSGERRRRFDLRMPAEPEVVCNTPGRVVVRLGGVFEDAAGVPLSELILFIEVLRDAPELRVQPVWIYLGRPNEELVESLTVTAHVPLAAGQARYGFGDEQGSFWDVIQRIRGEDPDGPRWPLARQVQLGSSFYRTEKTTFPAGTSWVKALEGQRAQGWCHLADDQLGVTGAMRYYWQEYPHSLAVDCDAGQIAFGLVPSQAPPLDLRRYSPCAYGGTMYETGQGPFNVDLHGPYGIAKAHELMLRFHGPADEDVAERALFFTRPLRAMTTGKHLAETAALGALAPGDARANAVDRTIAKIADFLVNERQVRGWYGLLDFGDVMSSFYSDLDRWAFDDGGFAWLNTESLPDYGLWLTALRFARADWLEAAIEMSRHNRDIDCYHRGQLKGLGSRHNVNHWGCGDKEWRVSMPLARRLHYYLTGDCWTAEYIRQTVAVYQSYDRTTRLAPSMTSAIAGVLVKWEMSNDPADERTLRNMADACAAAVRGDGQFTSDMYMDLATGKGHPVGDEPHGSTFFMNTFGGQHALVELAELLEHKELSSAIVRHADYWIGQDRAGYDLMGWIGHAWRATGEQRFLDAIGRGLQRLETAAASAELPEGKDAFPLVEVGGDGPLASRRHLIMPGLKRKNKVTCHTIGDVMHMPPYALGALAAGEASGKPRIGP